MVSIFAGRDSEGHIRYLNEVRSGLACACTCLVCGSALVAKKGTVNDWHFAHESGQTSPDCQVGAQNHMRELALELVRIRGMPPKPRLYTATARFGHFQQDVAWTAEILSVQWPTLGHHGRIAATLQLAAGFNGDLIALIEGEDPPRSRWHIGDAALALVIPMPAATAFRSKQDLESHLDQTMYSHWITLPDLHGALAAAEASLKAKHTNALQNLRQPFAKPLSMRTNGRPTILARAGHFSSAMEWGVEDQVAAPVHNGDANAAASESSNPPWAWDRKEHSSIFCYTFKDGSQWLLYETNSAGSLLRPWPSPEDGWDEALPRSLGTPDVELRAYRVSLLKFFEAVRSYSATMRNTSTPGEVEGFFSKTSR